MHRSAAINAAILHREDTNVFLSLFSVSGLSSFKEHIFQGTPFRACFQVYYM